MSTAANIRRHVAETLPDHDVRTPSRPGRTGVEVERPDGTVLTWLMVPGDGWEGTLTLPDGEQVELTDVPKGLTAAGTAELIADLVHDHAPTVP